MASTQRDIVIVIPTYNEAENLRELVSQILEVQPDADLLIVDDNSPDGTGRIADELAKTSPRVSVLHRQQKTGLGHAYVDGFKHILSGGAVYKYIIQMDADFSHAPEQLCALLEAAQHNDVVVGSRYIPLGKVISWSFMRRLLSLLANTCVRFILGRGIHDWTSGFRCFHAEVLNTIQAGTLKTRGYLFQIEMLFWCQRYGYRIREVPLTFTERKKGRTKFGFLEILEAFWGVLRLPLRG